mgnify:CR=1 FL=1
MPVAGYGNRNCLNGASAAGVENCAECFQVGWFGAVEIVDSAALRGHQSGASELAEVMCCGSAGNTDGSGEVTGGHFTGRGAHEKRNHLYTNRIGERSEPQRELDGIVGRHRSGSQRRAANWGTDIDDGQGLGHGVQSTNIL